MLAMTYCAELEILNKEYVPLFTTRKRKLALHTESTIED